MLKNFKRPVQSVAATRQITMLRVVVGVLLVANLAAAGILLFPPGGSAEDLEKELASLQVRAKAKRDEPPFALAVVQAQAEPAAQDPHC